MRLPDALREARDAPYVDAVGRPWPIEETTAPQAHRADRARAMAVALRWSRTLDEAYPADFDLMEDALAALEQEVYDAPS